MFKKLVLYVSVIAVAFLAPVVSADGGYQRPGKEERLNRMKKHLNLSESQVAQIREIHRNGGGREEVKAVLTDEQIQIIRDHRRKHPRPGSGPDKPPAEPLEE